MFKSHLATKHSITLPTDFDDSNVASLCATKTQNNSTKRSKNANKEKNNLPPQETLEAGEEFIATVDYIDASSADAALLQESEKSLLPKGELQGQLQNNVPPSTLFCNTNSLFIDSNGVPVIIEGLSLNGQNGLIGSETQQVVIRDVSLGKAATACVNDSLANVPAPSDTIYTNGTFVVSSNIPEEPRRCTSAEVIHNLSPQTTSTLFTSPSSEPQLQKADPTSKAQHSVAVLKKVAKVHNQPQLKQIKLKHNQPQQVTPFENDTQAFGSPAAILPDTPGSCGDVTRASFVVSQTAAGNKTVSFSFY